MATNIALALAVTVVGLAAMEWGVRWLAPQTLVRAYNVPDLQLGTYIAPNARYVDPHTAEHSYLVKTNGDAFRMDEEVDLSPERSRVMVYGDSFTFGWGVNLPDSYFGRLKARIEASRPRLQMINAGVGGYSSGHVKILMERHLPRFHPKAIIYFFNSNDFADNAITDIDYRVTAYAFDAQGNVTLQDVMPFARWKRFLLNRTPYAWLNRNSHLFVLTKGVVKRWLSWKPGLVVPELGDPEAKSQQPAAQQQPRFNIEVADDDGAAQHITRWIKISEAHVRRLHERASASAVPLLLIWVPAPREICPPRETSATDRLLRRGRAMLSEFSDRHDGLSFIDTTVLIAASTCAASQKARHRLSDGHFSATGNAWFAGLVGAHISRFLASALPRRPAGG